MDKLDFTVKGMRCAGCSANLQRKISVLAGIKNCSVNIATNTMSLECDPEKITVQEILSTVKKAGFQAELINNSTNNFTEAEEESKGYKAGEFDWVLLKKCPFARYFTSFCFSSEKSYAV